MCSKLTVAFNVAKATLVPFIKTGTIHQETTIEVISVRSDISRSDISKKIEPFNHLYLKISAISS